MAKRAMSEFVSEFYLIHKFVTFTKAIMYYISDKKTSNMIGLHSPAILDTYKGFSHPEYCIIDCSPVTGINWNWTCKPQVLRFFTTSPNLKNSPKNAHA